MNKLYSFIVRLSQDERAQDMVEYSLLAGFIAVAAGAVLPGISTSISTIFSKMASVTTAASNTLGLVTEQLKQLGQEMFYA